MYKKLHDSITTVIQNKKHVPLTAETPDKPLDTGTGTLVASLGKFGELLSISTYHRDHGWIVVNTLPQFPPDKYYDPAFVRWYRWQLADLNQEGFGLLINEPLSNLSYSWLGGCIPFVQGQAGGLNFKTFTWGSPHQGGDVLYQVALFRNDSAAVQEISLRFSLQTHLSRAAYGQLTEGGPIIPPQPDLRYSIGPEHGQFKLENPNLPAVLTAKLLGEFEEYSPTSSNCTIYKLTIPPGEGTALVAVYQLWENCDFPKVEPEAIIKALEEKTKSFPCSLVEAAAQNKTDYIILRNLDYILSCCSTTADDTVCVLTDHQLLPLSWNRDSYYQTSFLRSYYQRFYDEMDERQRTEIQEVSAGHLRWLFQKAERDPFWGRSHLANGKTKDHTFQLDQQCYPIIELAEHWETFNDENLVVELYPEAENLVNELLKLAHPETWFLPTEETPADDALELPYHFSSQLLWLRTLEKMDLLCEVGTAKKPRFADIRLQLKGAIWNHMVAEYKGRLVFAYAVDLKGRYKFYQDANDLPTPLCPEWGFCGPENDIWQNTMEFAFTEDNNGGYYPGRFGGLGSIHTPGPWPLGDVQQLMYSRLTGNFDLYNSTLAKLLSIAQADGILPEAIDAQTGRVLSRSWFSWPGAAFGWELLKNNKRRDI